MGDVGLYGVQEGVFRGAVEEFDVDGLLPAYEGGEETVHPVDHVPVGAADENGRKRAVDLGQPRHVLLVLSLQSRRLTGQERGDRNGDDL